MKVLVIGGTGHVGTFLIPKLVESGHDVYIGARGNTRLREGNFFEGAKFVTCDSESEQSLEGLKEYEFDTIVDFPGTAYKVWKVLGDSISHLVACGSLWMFGYPHVIPTPEISQDKVLFDGYDTRFDEMQIMLKESGTVKKAVFTAIMPPNICGPGKIPLDQYGGRELDYHKDMMSGKIVYLPEGADNLVGPCDADDIAQLFCLAVNQREAAGGHLFNVGSEYSLPASDFIKAYADIYGVDIPIERVTWEKYIKEINPDMGGWWHFYAHMLPDITKARVRLGYKPQYTPEQTLRRAVDWMKSEGML